MEARGVGLNGTTRPIISPFEKGSSPLNLLIPAPLAVAAEPLRRVSLEAGTIPVPALDDKAQRGCGLEGNHVEGVRRIGADAGRGTGTRQRQHRRPADGRVTLPGRLGDRVVDMA